MGQGIRGSLRLMGAELLGCEPGQIEVPDPDTDSSPFDTRTTSSRSTYMMGRALERAVADLHALGGERGYGEIVNEGGLDPDTGQGIASTHGTRARRARTSSVDDETGRVDASSISTRRLRRPGCQPRGRRAAERGLDDHGPRHRAARGHRLRDGQVKRQPLDYNLPPLGDLPGRMTHELIEREGAEATGSGRRRFPRCPRRSATRCLARSAGPPSCRSRPSGSWKRWTRGRAAMIVTGSSTGRAPRSSANRPRCCSTSCAPAGPALGARDLRDRHLRRLHRAARRRAGLGLPDAAPPRPQGARSRPSRGSAATTRSQRAFAEAHAFQCGWCTPGSCSRPSGCSGKPSPERRGDRRGPRRQPLPLWLLREDHRAAVRRPKSGPCEARDL